MKNIKYSLSIIIPCLNEILSLKKTLESEDFYLLVQEKIETTGITLKLSNQ